MTAILIDPQIPDNERREVVLGGELVVISPRATTQALVDFARELLAEAFAPYDPTDAQYHMPVERFVELFTPVKPRFIHHPRTRGLLRDIVEDLGCDLDDLYLDVPRLRGVTSDGYLTSGVGYAHHPHRDTWYSAPMAQLNWWLPIFEFESVSSMAFHPRYWNEAVQNGSRDFDYYEWNAVGRQDAAKHIRTDLRKQPKAEELLELEPQVRIVCPVGGIVLFAAAQMHSTVPNTSGRARFSIDFRTVNRSDLLDGRQAPNLDSQPTGTSLRDFLRASDGAPLDDDIIAAHDDPGARDGVLVFKPTTN
jgi:hypothetical protein